MDETGLQLNNTPEHVVAIKGSKNVAAVTSSEKGETISITACCNAEGAFTPPVCIFKEKNKKAEFEDGMPTGAGVFMGGKSAYVTKELFLKWLKQQFVPREPVGKVLLLLDGHSAHCSSVETLEADHTPKHLGYRIIRSDGENGQGGVLALIKKSLACAVIEKIQEPRRQAVLLELGDGTGITGVYNSPRKRLTTEALVQLFGRFMRHLVIGDLNAKHENWGNRVNNASGIILNNYMDRRNITIHVPDEPT
ncbi:Endonuclease-reverse transcriptase [Popillia japonica]|uniref:Endonuclease-reverse transcriptase n=1 Tax=Popillia japonica TaxID=7064 RepID=A0AAW1HTD7_POPJA